MMALTYIVAGVIECAGYSCYLLIIALSELKEVRIIN
jgi:hypothetical protein